MSILPDSIENYIENFCEPEDRVLSELVRETHLKTVHPRMLSGNFQGRLLTMITKMIRPVNVLEIGTFTGYSAICIARGLGSEGMLHTIEVNDEMESICLKYFEKAGVIDKIHFIAGDAIKVIPTLSGGFDMVFLDAEKTIYPELLLLLKDRIRSGGYLITDNVLWDGKICNEPAESDKMTKGVMKFNQMLHNDSDFEKIIIPVRDGIMISRKK